MRRWAGRPRSLAVRRRYLPASTHRMIRGAVASGESMADVARAWGVSYGCVTGIVYGTRKPRVPCGAVVPGTARGTRVPVQRTCQIGSFPTNESF